MKNLILDLDDTLVRCSVYYHHATDKFVEYQVTRTRMSDVFIRKIVNTIDLNCIDVHGFSSYRMPRAFAAASLALDAIANREANTGAALVSKEIGYEVFDAPYPLFDGVWDVLLKYKSLGYRLFLLTKGDLAVQKRKIELHQLDTLFTTENIHIVAKKNADVLTELLESHNLEKSETVCIGDSLRDDIEVANIVGVTSVFVKRNDAPTWAYENVQSTPTHTIESVALLPSIIPF